MFLTLNIVCSHKCCTLRFKRMLSSCSKVCVCMVTQTCLCYFRSRILRPYEAALSSSPAWVCPHWPVTSASGLLCYVGKSVCCTSMSPLCSHSRSACWHGLARPGTARSRCPLLLRRRRIREVFKYLRGRYLAHLCRVCVSVCLWLLLNHSVLLYTTEKYAIDENT